MNHKQTSSLVEALLYYFNVAFVDLLVVQTGLSLPLKELRILVCDSAHPVLFGFCSLGVAVIVNYLKFINQPNNHKLWEVWDSRGRSFEVLQRVSHWNRKLMSSFSLLISHFNKSLNKVVFLHTQSKRTAAHSRHPHNICCALNKHRNK